MLVYVHFPWCLAKCPYCDFVSYATPREAVPHVAYADAVVRELEARLARRPDLAGREVTSVFFGGGTPSLWEPRELGRVLAAVKARLAVAEGAEITVECNPTSLDRERARALREQGVDRVSIGTQSLRASELEYLGRLHDPGGARAAVSDALSVEGLRVSSDLIFGLPEQAPADARAQALELAALGLEHVSAYQLTIEPGTRFGELAKRGRLPRADDGVVAAAFVEVDAALTGAGFEHYEISNYAKPGQRSRHNLGYWRGDDYLGLGCAAVGFVRDGGRGRREKNETEPGRYMHNAHDPGALAAFAEDLDGEAMLRERIMLGLRIADGVDLARAREELGVEPWTPERAREVERLVARGRLERAGDVLTIPRAAWLFADDTAARLF